MELMANVIRPYAWGSRTAIAEMLGRPVPADHPQAEMWIGAHQADPSVVHTPDGDHSLIEWIDRDPEHALGPDAVREWGGRLPFLLKVLAAAEPLSLQAHPSAGQARVGFAAEQAAGLALSSPQRNYKDESHKPELICALTDFHALCGFRDPAEVTALLADLGVPELERYTQLLSGQPDADGMRALFSSVITLPTRVLKPLLDSVLAACVERVRAGSDYADEFRTALNLGERYPGDPGVLACLLMNHLHLKRGEALYLGAGNLHAYLYGVGVEIMANSDNVLRGGLTPKHVDVPELMRVLDFRCGAIEVICPEGEDHGIFDYGAPTPEFSLSRLEPVSAQGPLSLDRPSGRILLMVEGEGIVHAADGTTTVVPQGNSLWIAAKEQGVTLTGEGVAFLAADGLPHPAAGQE